MTQKASKKLPGEDRKNSGKLRTHRLVIKGITPFMVSADMVYETAKKELGLIGIHTYEFAIGNFFESVDTPQGTKMIPISIVKIVYVEGEDYPPQLIPAVDSRGVSSGVFRTPSARIDHTDQIKKLEELRRQKHS